MRVLILAFCLLVGAAWHNSDAVQAIIAGPADETPAERAEITKIPAVPAADEFASRTRMMEEVRDKILARDIAWLDAKERALREQKARTNDGVWKLEIYYNAMWYLGQISPSSGCSDPAEEFLANWRNASPNSPAPFIVSARRLLDKGWCFRGNDSAGKVSGKAWAPFHEHVEAAYEMLAKHKAVASVDPHYYAVMASAYVDQARPEGAFRELLKEAVAKEPYYYELYNEAFRYYEPQWFGGYDEEEALAQFAVEQTREKDRTSAFARVYWRLMSCGCMPPTSVVNLKALRKAMHDLVEVYPTAWNVSHMARMACEIDDLELARSYFRALPAGDDGKSGWASSKGVDQIKWEQCRFRVGLPTA